MFFSFYGWVVNSALLFLRAFLYCSFKVGFSLAKGALNFVGLTLLDKCI